MCNHPHPRNPLQCIVPPYMIEQIRSKAEGKRTAYASSVTTRFQDELFRRKRTLLTEMTTKEMRTVLAAISPAAKPARSAKGGKTAKPPKPQVAGPHRMIYDAQHTENLADLPGKLARKEGQKAVADKDVNNIYANSGHTWDFYYNQLKRNSIDGKGLALVHSVHFGVKFGNASWDGTQMIYGDGDDVFKSFTTDIDITGHELTHGVVQYEADLQYIAQSGAINESMADVFGVMVRQLALNEDTTKDENWLIGKTCMRGTGYALRSMAKPGSAYKNHPILKNDPQPGNMQDYNDLPNTRDGDYGGVHINSGIPNHAFYLAARAIGGQPWLKAGRIWYQALCDETLLNATSQFKDLANATITKAESLFGTGSNEAKAVKKAWNDVGL